MTDIRVRSPPSNSNRGSRLGPRDWILPTVTSARRPPLLVSAKAPTEYQREQRTECGLSYLARTKPKTVLLFARRLHGRLNAEEQIIQVGCGQTACRRGETY